MNDIKQFLDNVAAKCVGHNANFGTIGNDTDNEMVDIFHANPTIEAETTPGNPAFGGTEKLNKVPLAKQLKRLKEAVTLEELKGNKELRGVRDDKGNFHAMKKDRAGQLAGALHAGWRLIFVPKHDPVPLDANGNLDWSKVTAIEIQELVDYHKPKGTI